MRNALATLLTATVLVVGLSTCASGTGDSIASKLKPCDFEEPVEGGALCGSYSVFEDRRAKSGRRIDINIVVLPATGHDPAPDPLFLFSGGPGSGSAQSVGQAGGALWKAIRERRDIVLIDQRGTGDSHPLNCPRPESGLAGYFGPLFPPTLEECRSELEKKADLKLYTTSMAMEDIDEIRVWLGYEKINLMGGSYGSRAAQVYMQRHPDSVRTAILQGVVAFDQHLPQYHAPDAQRGLNLLLDACASDAACSGAFPALNAEFAAVVERLRESPVPTEITDPESGETATVAVTGDIFATDLRFMLYSPATAVEVPAVVHAAFEGDFRPLLYTALPFRKFLEAGISLGMYLSVTCAEDLPFNDLEEGRRLAEGTFLGDSRIRQQAAACRFWPRGEIPKGFHKPLQSDAAVLIVSGFLDPVTPPRWAEKVAAGLPNSRQVTVAEGHHGFGGLSNLDCLLQMTLAFLEAGLAEGLDVSCTETMHRPPFVTDPEKLRDRTGGS